MQKKILASVLLVILVLSVFYVGYYVGANSGSTIIERGSFVETASYVVFKDGSTYKAKNGTTGAIDYSGTSAVTVMQTAVNAGTKTIVKEGVFEFSGSAPHIVIPTKHTFLGAGIDKTIFRGINASSKGYMIMTKPEYDQSGYVEYVEIGGFTVDAQNLATNGVGLQDLRYSYVHDIKVTGNYDGVGVVIGTKAGDFNVCPNNLVERIYVGIDEYKVSVGDQMIVAGQIDSVIRDFHIKGGGGSGLTMACNLRTTFSDFIIHETTGSAISVEPAGNDRVNQVDFVRGKIYNITGAGVFTSDLQQNYYANDITLDSLMTNNTNQGIILSGIRGAKVVNCEILNVNSGFVGVINSRDVLIANNKMEKINNDNGIGIDVVNYTGRQTKLGYIQINDNLLFQDPNPTGTQKAIRIYSAPEGNNRISDNTFHDWDIVIETNPAYPAGFAIENNGGWTTENSGSATISASTSVTFDHGLVGTPTFVSASFNSTAVDGWKWTATSTQITITVTPSGTYTVYWTAEYKP